MAVGGLAGEDLVRDIVGDIYEAALDAQLWPGILNRIGDVVGGPVTVFGFYDPANGIANVHAPRSDPDVLRRFNDWIPNVPALPCIGNYPPGEIFTGSDVISPDDFASTAFYHEIWQPSGCSTMPLVTNLFADGAASGHFASHRLLNRPFDGGQKRLFAALSQHLIRAVALQRRLYHLEIANESALSGLDGLQQGFLLLDKDARILFANRMARALLDARDGLRLEAGVLSTFDIGEERTLRGLIASCASGTDIAGSGGTIALRRGTARMPVDVQMSRVQPETPIASTLWTRPQRPIAIMLVTDPETEIRSRIESLRERFGFTPAEAAFALEIVKGDGRQGGGGGPR